MEKIKSDKVLKKRRKIKLAIKPSESPIYIKAYGELTKCKPSCNVSRCESADKRSHSPSMIPSRIIRSKYSKNLFPEKSANSIKIHTQKNCLMDTIKACYTELSKGPSFRNTKTLYKLQFSQTNSKTLSPTRLKSQTTKLDDKVLPKIKSNFRLDLTSFRKLLGEAPSWTHRKEIPNTIVKKTKKPKKSSIELKGWD
ncbi:hypothetical protein SteCoe_18862 [Stentor coeruleus]|uniref:Uncharacterized protein n=1 Tax=Stentor coeruleus TaxID=5963 RepID=A0A1R2BVX5_9CILI|nr:hypothetical protein SteCoe_18862 [Stentor coeruleus]